MNVCYVTMVFPTNGETFACLDVRALRESGVFVSVHAMRPARIRGLDEPFRPFASRARARAAAQLLAERGLADLPVSHSTMGAVLRGMLFAVTHPSTLRDLVAWIWCCNRLSPQHLLKSLVLIPRSLDIFSSIRRRRPEVVHLFWGHYPAIVGYLVGRHLPNTVVSMFLGAYDLERRYPGSAALARSAHVVWTHCHHNAHALAGLGVPSSHVRVVHRGIDVEMFADAGETKIPGRVVTASRLRRAKAVDDVVAAFAKLLPRWPGATLMILGDGPDRERLALRAEMLGIASAVTFRGHVSHAQVRDELAGAEVFVLLSRSASDRLPNVVKEAMASRCACVVSETPGIEELIQDGATGCVVAQGDVEGAAECVDGLLRCPERRAAMGRGARDHILAHFDVRRSMHAYQEGWMELLAGPAERHEGRPRRSATGEAQ
jgi:glycosyltransferase involved in cell wall biosynthesis